MKGRILGFFIGLFSVALIGVVSFYLYAAYRYRDGFTYNTKINGVFCTGKDVSTVNNELVNLYEAGNLKISSEYTEEEIIELKDIDYKIDFTDSLYKIIENQNCLLWFFNIFEKSNEKYLNPVITFDEQKLSECLLKLNVSKEYGPDRSQTVSIMHSPIEGYYLYEDITPLLDFDYLVKESNNALAASLFNVYVPAEAFSVRELTDEMKMAYSEWDFVLPYLTEKIVYDMGAEQIHFDASILSKFIEYDEKLKRFVRNEDGSIYVIRESVEYYIDYLCDKYDTYVSPRTYTTFSGEEKVINNVYYGTLINRKSEKKYLYESIINNVSETHIPTYIREGYVRGENDIGDDYIEIDLTNQVLYVILDDEIAYTTDVVTGKPSQGDATPPMVCYVIRKRLNAVLRGEGYVSKVKYWMPIHGGIGIHDATWQKAFGGDRYLRYGSHGCINVSLEAAKEIYDLVFEGMPVIVYK